MTILFCYFVNDFYQNTSSMKFKHILLLPFLFLTFFVQSQRYLQKAEMAYKSQNFADGIEICKDTYDKIDNKGVKAKKYKGRIAFYLAECYRETGAIKEANEWYDKTILLQYFEEEPDVYFYNAEVLRMMGEIEKAIKNYNKFLEKTPNDERAELGLSSCEKIQEWKNSNSKYIVKNETMLNQEGYDMNAVFGDKKMSKLYFSSSRKGVTGDGVDPRIGEAYMDIWVSEMDRNGNWGEPMVVPGEINTMDNEGSISFDGRYKTLFFTRCPNVKKASPACQIWMSKAKGRSEWDTPVRVNVVEGDSVTVGQPCASADGRAIIFVSDLPGGHGGRDLWFSEYNKRDDSWSTPVNLGPEINTPGNEMFPSFSLEGDLYFSSDGHPGIGGLDLFIAKKIDGEEFKFENPVNLGIPLNSENNDYALIEYSDKKGYFTSERKNKNGGSDFDADIYSYELPPSLFDLKVIVSEIGQKQIKIADVSVKVVGSDGSSWEGFTNDRGMIFWSQKPNGDRYINEKSSYEITISKEGFQESKKIAKVSTEGLRDNQTFAIEMGLLPINVKPIRLPEIRNVFGEAELLVNEEVNSKDSLNFVYDLLMEYPGMVLELSSHTDARGSEKANQELSEKRAQECVRYLVEEKGLNPKRLVPIGKGEMEPASWIDPETGEKLTLAESFINGFKSKDKDKYELFHALNRRTEGRVISMDFEEQTDEIQEEK